MTPMQRIEVEAESRRKELIVGMRASLSNPNLIRLEKKPEYCSCGDRPKDHCPGEWEPGCDLGNNPKYARRVELQCPAEQKESATITIQEAWEAAGGNPGIKATKEELIAALKLLDKVCDEAEQPKQQPIPFSGADEKPPVFGRRWRLAHDGFGIQLDDNGPYVHIDDALSVLHTSLEHQERLWMEQEPPVAFADQIAFDEAMKSGKSHKVWPEAGDYEARSGRKLRGLYTRPLGPHPDTVRLAYLYSGTQTSSDALVNAEMKLLNGKTLTLEEARAAIDDAMSKPMKY